MNKQKKRERRNESKIKERKKKDGKTKHHKKKENRKQRKKLEKKVENLFIERFTTKNLEKQTCLSIFDKFSASAWLIHIILFFKSKRYQDGVF